MTFADVIECHDWGAAAAAIQAKSAADVERALARPGHGGLDDFMALISPAAAAYLEPIWKDWDAAYDRTPA